MIVGKKPEEQILKEWAVDCIRLRGGIKVDEQASEKRRITGNAGARYWTKEAMKVLAKAIRECDFSKELVGIDKSAKDSAKFVMYLMAAFDMKKLTQVHLWMLEMNRISEVTVQWVSSWTSIDYMYEYVRAEYKKATGKDVEEPGSSTHGVRERMLVRRPWRGTP